MHNRSTRNGVVDLPAGAGGLADADFSIVNVEITIGTGATQDKLTGTANLEQRHPDSGRWRLTTEP